MPPGREAPGWSTPAVRGAIKKFELLRRTWYSHQAPLANSRLQFLFTRRDDRASRSSL